jgi:plastocyanin
MNEVINMNRLHVFGLLQGVASEYRYLLPAVLLIAVTALSGCVSPGNSNNANTNTAAGPIKEFTVTKSVSFENGQPSLQFTPAEITVNRGDTVKISIAVQGTGFNRTDNGTANGTFNRTGFNPGNRTDFNRTGGRNMTRGTRPGSFTFNIDELNVHDPLQPGVAIEFVASQVGDFAFYSGTKGNGPSGILHILP